MRDKVTLRRRRRILERLTGKPLRPGRLIRRAGGFYRIRRDKLVRIPDEWVGRPYELFQPTRRFAKWRIQERRPSKMGTKKLRRRHDWKDHGRVPREKRERGHPKRRKIGHPRNRAPRHLRRRMREGLEEGLWD